MEIFSLTEWEENFDELFARVENGERLGVVRRYDKNAITNGWHSDVMNLQRVFRGTVAYEYHAYNGVKWW